MDLVSVKLGSLPASESIIALEVHLLRRATASDDGSPQSSRSRLMRLPSTAALMMTRKYACAESKPRSLALTVSCLRTAASSGTWMVEVSLIVFIGYQNDIIMSMIGFPSRDFRRPEMDTYMYVKRLVTPAGFEPAIAGLRTRSPKPLDEGAIHLILSYKESLAYV